MKDTFYTINHNGKYIHAHYDRSFGHEVFTVNLEKHIKTFKSLRAAKRAATMYVKRHDAAMERLAERLATA